MQGECAVGGEAKDRGDVVTSESNEGEGLGDGGRGYSRVIRYKDQICTGEKIHLVAFQRVPRVQLGNKTLESVFSLGITGLDIHLCLFARYKRMAEQGRISANTYVVRRGGVVEKEVVLFGYPCVYSEAGM